MILAGEWGKGEEGGGGALRALIRDMEEEERACHNTAFWTSEKSKSSLANDNVLQTRA